LPKYNQFAEDFSYEMDLKKLKDKLIRHIKIEYDLEKGIRIIKMIDSEITNLQELFDYLKKFEDKIMQNSEEFDYVNFILCSNSFISNLGNKPFFSSGFNGEYGLVTEEFVFDLWDAWMFKRSSIISLKDELVKYFDLPKNQDEEQFDIKIPTSDSEKIYNFLIDNNYINKNLPKEDFISIFSSGKVLNQKIEWIDKSERNKRVTIQTLFQLLDSLDIQIKDSKGIVLKKIKDFIKSCFSNDFGNINTKCNDFKSLCTDRYTKINSFIITLNLNKS